MKVDLEKMCGPCQIEKKIRISHKMMQHPSTTRVLDRLHMDQMGPIHVESIGGKRYVFVSVEYYSRFSCVNFLIEKPNTFNAFKIMFLKLKR